MKRFGQLDALRFFFALYVVWGHTAGWTGLNLNGGLAVDFFFILSGFVVTHLLYNRDLTYKDFFVSRFARLWPLHIVTMLVMVALSPWDEAQELNLVLNTLLLQNIGAVDRLTLNSPSWSVSAEMIVGMVVLFPIVKHRLQIVAVILLLLSSTILLQAGGKINYLHTQPYLMISLGLVRCTMGSCLGYFSYLAYLTYKEIDLKSYIKTTIHLFCIIVMFLIPAATIGNGGRLGAILFSAVSIFILTAVHSPVTEWLNRKLHRLGNLSYGIYLIHLPLLHFGYKLNVMPSRTDLESTFSNGEALSVALPLAGFFVLLFVLAALAYRFVETPAKIWMTQFLLPKKQDSAFSEPEEKITEKHKLAS